MQNATSRWTWPAVMAAVLTVMSGCSSPRSWLPQARSSPAASAASRPAPSNVIVVHGRVGYWPDRDDFVGRLSEQGAEATVIRGWDVNRTAERIVEARKSGAGPRPLVLIGYSRGANDAIRLTRRLQKDGVEVDMLVLLETAVQDTVPANVAACLNVYKSSIADEWVPAFRGLPVTVESAQTELVNYNLRFHDEAVGATEIGQFTVCQNPVVQGMIADRVAQTLHRAEAVSEPAATELAGGPD